MYDFVTTVASEVSDADGGRLKELEAGWGGIGKVSSISNDEKNSELWLYGCAKSSSLRQRSSISRARNKLIALL